MVIDDLRNQCLRLSLSHDLSGALTDEKARSLQFTRSILRQIRVVPRAALLIMVRSGMSTLGKEEDKGGVKRK